MLSRYSVRTWWKVGVARPDLPRVLRAFSSQATTDFGGFGALSVGRVVATAAVVATAEVVVCDWRYKRPRKQTTFPFIADLLCKFQWFSLQHATEHDDRHPGKGIALDLYIMRGWASVLDYVKPKLTNQRPYDVKLIDTFGGASYCELDYINEGKNQDLFAEALASRVPEVRVPKVFWQCTSRRVITTEWIEGEQLAKSPPEVINRLTPIGVRCFLAQLLDIGTSITQWFFL